jgi:hypothetical protein
MVILDLKIDHMSLKFHRLINQQHHPHSNEEGSAQNQHRHMRVRENLLGFAAQQQALDALAAV